MIEHVIPKNIFHKKVRLGPRQDGGYVFSDDIFKNCQALMTYGVGGEVRFECDFIMRY